MSERDHDDDTRIWLRSIARRFGITGFTSAVIEPTRFCDYHLRDRNDREGKVLYYGSQNGCKKADGNFE